MDGNDIGRQIPNAKCRFIIFLYDCHTDRHLPSFHVLSHFGRHYMLAYSSMTIIHTFLPFYVHFQCSLRIWNHVNII